MRIKNGHQTQNPSIFIIFFPLPFGFLSSLFCSTKWRRRRRRRRDNKTKRFSKGFLFWNSYFCLSGTTHSFLLNYFFYFWISFIRLFILNFVDGNRLKELILKMERDWVIGMFFPIFQVQPHLLISHSHSKPISLILEILQQELGTATPEMLPTITTIDFWYFIVI